MPLDIPQLGAQVGGGAAIGAVVGFAAKKILKLVMVLIGAQMAFLAYLENQGFISVNWAQMNSIVGFGGEGGGAVIPPFVMNLFSIAPVGGGFTLGAMAGFKKG